MTHRARSIGVIPLQTLDVRYSDQSQNEEKNVFTTELSYNFLGLIFSWKYSFMRCLAFGFLTAVKLSFKNILKISRRSTVAHENNLHCFLQICHKTIIFRSPGCADSCTLSIVELHCFFLHFFVTW